MIEIRKLRRNFIRYQDQILAIKSDLRFRKLMLALKEGSIPLNLVMRMANGAPAATGLSMLPHAATMRCARRNMRATLSSAMPSSCRVAGKMQLNDMLLVSVDVQFQN